MECMQQQVASSSRDMHSLTLKACAQIHGTRNKRNIAKALILALEGQQMPEDVYQAAAAKEAAAAAAAQAVRAQIPELVARGGKLMIANTLGRSALAQQARV